MQPDLILLAIDNSGAVEEFVYEILKPLFSKRFNIFAVNVTVQGAECEFIVNDNFCQSLDTFVALIHKGISIANSVPSPTVERQLKAPACFSATIR
jgi:hypothetical protein